MIDAKVLDSLTRLSVAPSMSSLYYQLFKDSDVDVGHCATARRYVMTCALYVMPVAGVFDRWVHNCEHRSMSWHANASRDTHRDPARTSSVRFRDSIEVKKEGTSWSNKLRSCDLSGTPSLCSRPTILNTHALVHVSVGAAHGLRCGIGATMIATTYVCRILMEVLRKAPTESAFAYSVV